jgi:hypothetical protein
VSAAFNDLGLGRALARARTLGEMLPTTRLPGEQLAAPRLRERTSEVQAWLGNSLNLLPVTTQRITSPISIFWMAVGRSGKSAARRREPLETQTGTPPSGALTDLGQRAFSYRRCVAAWRGIETD